MQVEVLTDKGLLRTSNEDRYLVDKMRGLFIVADGMGGHRAGETASSLAVETIKRSCLELDNQRIDAYFLREAIIRANEVIFRAAQQDEAREGMGTTITAALIDEGNLYVAHVGDSRAYLWRNGELYLLTNDHSVVGELVREGGLTKNEALRHPQRNVLTRALGTSPEVEIDFVTRNMVKGDLLLLCTDGLTGTVSDAEVKLILQKYPSLKEAVKELTVLALQKGGTDNITTVLVNYD